MKHDAELNREVTTITTKGIQVITHYVVQVISMDNDAFNCIRLI